MMSAPARIGQPHLLQTLQLPAVKFTAKALTVRSVRPGVVGSALVPVKSEPTQVILDLKGILPPRTLRIEILYAENPASAAAAHRQPAQQRGCDVT